MAFFEYHKCEFPIFWQYEILSNRFDTLHIILNWKSSIWKVKSDFFVVCFRSMPQNAQVLPCQSFPKWRPKGKRRHTSCHDLEKWPTPQTFEAKGTQTSSKVWTPLRRRRNEGVFLHLNWVILDLATCFVILLLLIKLFVVMI